MLLHAGAVEVSRSKVKKVKTPPPEGAHYPIPHIDLVAEVSNVLTDHGMQIVNEQHSLWQDGLRYFGLMELKSERSDYATVVGLRNSHDKSFCAALACGGRVFVCDNLAFNGEIVIGRKHTRYISDDLHRLTNNAIGRLADTKIRQEERIDIYQETAINDDATADHLIMEAYRSKVINVQRIGKVWQEWENPEHEEFKKRTAWSLFNAFTATFDGSMSLKSGPTLHGVLDQYCGIELHQEAA